MFYHFSQNNSGGSFDWSEGLGHHVVVEAGSADEANTKLESLGGYFDGVGDCPCCGDRWYPLYDNKGTAEPTVYDSPAKDYFTAGGFLFFWGKAPDHAEIVIHYLDGRVEKMFPPEKA